MSHYCESPVRGRFSTSIHTKLHSTMNLFERETDTCLPPPPPSLSYPPSLSLSICPYFCLSVCLAETFISKLHDEMCVVVFSFFFFVEVIRQIETGSKQGG